FFLFGYNNSLDVLKTINPAAWQVVEEYNIDRYGDYRNWSLFWSKASIANKESVLKYITERE
ncbi:hypothetical protein N4G37_14185, partial [Enterococcus faecalis]|uniref:hypothetical protein n=1 Tax=Enterococcus faecalis TaxID=1351 RepID=UPI0021B0A3AE